jgi:hypothetical protein
VIGDSTGCSDAVFFNEPLVTKGSTLTLKNVNARVVK